MTRLDHAAIARLLNISPAAAQRLTGSTKAILSAAEGDKVYDLGLRLDAKFTSVDGTPKKFTNDQIISALSEYSQVCPAVYNWICSGAFESLKLPDTVSKGNLVHAARTAGRIRAGLLRAA